MFEGKTGKLKGWQSPGIEPTSPGTAPVVKNASVAHHLNLFISYIYVLNSYVEIAKTDT